MYENGIVLSSLSPKDQKRLNKQWKRRWQKLAKWAGFSDKTLWDWLQLLSILAVPVVIAVATMWFSAQQSQASSQASDQQHKTNLQVAADNRQKDIQISQNQQQDTAIQTYLDRMSDLLLNNKLHESKLGDEVRSVAQGRTLTILPQLNDMRHLITTSMPLWYLLPLLLFPPRLPLRSMCSIRDRASISARTR